MAKIRYGIIGAGKRCTSYIQSAKHLPELFELVGILVDTKEIAKQYQTKYDLFVTTEEANFLDLEFDFIVVALDTAYSVSEESASDLIIRLIKKGYPVLSEMNFATSLKNLMDVWTVSQQYPGKLQMAEPYNIYPTHYSKIRAIQKGRIGDTYAISLSMIPGASAMYLIRRYLGLGIENALIYGKLYTYPVIAGHASANACDSQIGKSTDHMMTGEMINQERLRTSIEFESGKVAFYDCLKIQPYPQIRNNHLNIQGVYGEIDGDNIIHLSRDNHPLKSKFHINYDINGGGISKISLEGEELFINVFTYKGFTEEEFASCILLIKMNDYLKKGHIEYAIDEAFYDMRMSLAFQEAATTGSCIKINCQEWNENSSQ